MSLQRYLETLNSSETQWTVYVHAEDVDSYKCSQWNEEYPWVSIGTPEALSFGYQSMSDAIATLLESGEYVFNGRKIKVNAKAIAEAYSDGRLGEKFRQALEEDAQYIMSTWSEIKAEDFIMNELPEILNQAKESHEGSLVEA